MLLIINVRSMKKYKKYTMYFNLGPFVESGLNFNTKYYINYLLRLFDSFCIYIVLKRKPKSCDITIDTRRYRFIRIHIESHFFKIWGFIDWK